MIGMEQSTGYASICTCTASPLRCHVFKPFTRAVNASRPCHCTMWASLLRTAAAHSLLTMVCYTNVLLCYVLPLRLFLHLQLLYGSVGIFSKRDVEQIVAYTLKRFVLPLPTRG